MKGMRNVFKLLGLEKSTAEKVFVPQFCLQEYQAWILVLMLFVHELDSNSTSSELTKAVRKYLNLYSTCQTHKDMQMMSNMWKGRTSRVIRFPLACLPG